ncbi:hypothetical protein B9Z55_021136 [Caenorhabditis nigoni]|uniref:F-box domain-containing protein n=1 Tax=Caenorhabditis nigoni TaxID=1611254 RepID=A0A2G5TQU4_9PELO|nr:hypothetical protein B9Z55_021136 [Caenorhabditis nigoni]
MSNILKTDDKTILSVILYQFLHGKSAYSSFKEFNSVVKDNFIDLDDFEFWFNRFENGKFDEKDDIFSISDFKRMLSDDQHCLRACIFFEYLKENKIKSETEIRDEEVLSVYMRMHEVIDIDYSEFSFCFYRFINRVFNFGHNSEPCSFSDLPLETIRKIVRKLNFPDRCRFRKVSYNLRNIVDDTKIGIDEINIRITKFVIAVSVERLPLAAWISRMEFKYYQLGDTCVMDYSFGRKQFKRTNCLDLASKDLSILLNTSKIRILNIKFADNESFINFENVLTFLNAQIHVKLLSLHVSNAEQVVKILSYLKPGTLESIAVYSFHDRSNHEIVLREGLKMDQWRQAKDMQWYFYEFPLPVKYLLHFCYIWEVKLPYFDPQQFQEIKETLLKQDHIKCWYFTWSILQKVDENEMNNLFGPIEADGVRRLEIPNTNAYYKITVHWLGMSITKENR